MELVIFVMVLVIFVMVLVIFFMEFCQKFWLSFWF